MKKNIKTMLLTLLFGTLTFLLLTFPKESLAFSFTGLQLWFNRMIPTLLPFMILSGIMIRLNLTENFVRILSPVLSPLLHISLNAIYAVIVGFLCGFPMGAKVIADLYSRNKITREEASFLLSFCNNIGPIYFISFVLPIIGVRKKIPYIFGMYALPFLYGIILRYTVYKNGLAAAPRPVQHRPKTKITLTAAEGPDSISLLDALDDSIMSGLYSISKLGGYMVLFNLLNLIPAAFLGSGRLIKGTQLAPTLNCLFEITSGISVIGNSAPLIILLLLPFGGFSCIAQTYSMIKETDLSLKNHIAHKIILTGITCLYYELWNLLSPSTFLL